MSVFGDPMFLRGLLLGLLGGLGFAVVVMLGAGWAWLLAEDDLWKGDAE